MRKNNRVKVLLLFSLVIFILSGYSSIPVLLPGYRTSGEGSGNPLADAYDAKPGGTK